jgi:hypothetical protein
MNLSHLVYERSSKAHYWTTDAVEGRKRGGKDVSIYSINLGQRENSVIWKNKHQILLCGELALEKAMDLS